jgi:acyl-CoA thioesterase FadM
MARIKINLPDQFQFQCTLTVRITDINYGNHVGNDAMLSIIHEARMQYLQHLGYSEMNMEGVGMIMSDAGLEFKSELFYGEQVLISVSAGDFSKLDLTYFTNWKKEKTKN